MINNTFFERLDKIYNKDDIELILKWLNSDKITSFRINTLKSDKNEIESFLNENNIEFKTLVFFSWAYIIEKKHEFFLKWSRIFYDGKIYVQWVASLIPAILLNPRAWEKILDVTAAPGSKTTQICAMMENKGEIVASEQNQIRFDKLNYNLKLQWCDICNAIKTDALKLQEKFEEWYFDRILLDAPCSAEWRINLNIEKTYWFWSLENISKKQKLQLLLLESVIPLLKAWWTLVYSTCTLAPEENEEVIDFICKKYSFKIEKNELDFEFSRPWIIEFDWKKYNDDISNTIRILPSVLSEGFYVAKLLKV